MKTTIPAFLPQLNKEIEIVLNRLGSSYGYMVRYSFKRLLDGKLSMGELEKKLSADTGLSIRHAKDAIEDARQTIKSQHELVKYHLQLWESRLENTTKKLNFYKKERPKALRKIKGLERKIEKQNRKIAFWKKHKENHTFPPVIFGGKDLFEKRCKGLISKEQWNEARNGRICSRGDESKGGNPNLRVIYEEDQFFLQVSTDVNLGVGKKRPTYEKIKIPLYIAKKVSKKTGKVNGKKYVQLMIDTLTSGEAYKVEVLKRKGRYYIHITVNEAESSLVTSPENGYRGMDTNPDGLAIAHITLQGNPKKFEWLGDGRLQDAPTHKRNNLIGELVAKEIKICKEEGTGLIIEDLEFINDKDISAKFNRMSHSFCYRKILEGIERKAKLEGVEVIKVKPQFTSIIGRLKYQSQYGISVHQSAAMVIARRGIGLGYEKVPKVLVKLCIKEDKRDNFYKMNEWKQWSSVKKSVESKLKKKGKYLNSWLDMRKELFKKA